MIELRGGNWRAGWALDYHTISSAHVDGHLFKTARSEAGELLYRLKYRSDLSKVEPLAEMAAKFLETRLVLPSLAVIIPVPPSMERVFQPVNELALSIGRKINLPVALEYLIKVKSTPPLKGMDDKKGRRKELRDAFRVKDAGFADRCVLVFDDLFRSGETLHEITRTLIEQGRVADVFVLTLTKTRKRK
jgi:competence protein ComFC